MTERQTVTKLGLIRRMNRLVAMIRTARNIPHRDLLEDWNELDAEAEELEARWAQTIDNFTAQRIRRTLDARAFLRRDRYEHS